MQAAYRKSSFKRLKPHSRVAVPRQLATYARTSGLRVSSATPPDQWLPVAMGSPASSRMTQSGWLRKRSDSRSHTKGAIHRPGT